MGLTWNKIKTNYNSNKISQLNTILIYLNSLNNKVTYFTIIRKISRF